MNCLICNKELKNNVALGLHIKNNHNQTSKEYYDKYIRKENEGICPVCGKETNFFSLGKGYNVHCSYKCTQNDKKVREKFENTCLDLYGAKNPYQSEICKEKSRQTHRKRTLYDYNLQNPNTIKRAKQTKFERYGDENYNNIEKKKQTCIKHYGVDLYSKTDKFRELIKSRDFTESSKKSVNSHYINVNKQIELGYTPIQELFAKYGQSWYKNKIVPIIYKHHVGFVSPENKKIVENYYKTYNGHASQQENILYNIIKKYYKGSIIRGDRKILDSYELDFYIPDLKLAFEYNGTYWHSTKRKDKAYHFKKSLECFTKGIRLVHIYDYEDIKEVELFIKSIFNNTENPTNNFDKYSPLQFNYTDIKFSKETLIYKDDYGFEIYGAGTFNLF